MIENFYEMQKGNFLRLITENKLSHAYLFFGQDQVLIFEFSQKLANFLENGKFEMPKILSDSRVFSPNEKRTIGIDEARVMQDFLYRAPVISKKRTAIVLEAENLTPEAQNALLKIIEEPPKNTLIILICNEPSSLMATIISRIQKIYFPPQKNLKKVKKEEGKINVRLDEAESKRAEIELEKILAKLIKEPIKNEQVIKIILERLKLVKSLNLNEKLQMKYINACLKKTKLQ